MVTKQWVVKYRYKTSPDQPWLYDTIKTQAKSYAEARERVRARLSKELKAAEIEL